MEQKVEQVIRDVFKLDDGFDLAQAAPGEIPQWDSLGHVALLSAVESAFDIQLSPEDIADVDSVDALKEVVKRYVS